MNESKRMAAVLPGLIVLLTATVLSAQGPPEALPLRELSFPPFREHTLSNGAEVIIVPQHEQPFVSVNLIIRAGNTADPDGLEGLASFAAQLLNKGTLGRSALEIAEAVDFMGASLGAGAGLDNSSVTLGALTPDLPTGLALMADIVMNPTFPDEELELLRTQTLTGLRLQLSQAPALANLTFAKAIYGDHPYGRTQTPTSTEAITRDGIVAFHADFYRPNNTLFVVAGDVDPERVVDQLEEAFRGWAPGEIPVVDYPPVPTRARAEVILMHKPGSVQSSVRVGHPLMRGDAPDWTAMQVANQILGATAASRLFTELREVRGWTYGAYSSATRNRDFGFLRGTMEVRNEVTDSAVAGMLAEIERMRSEMVPPEELERVQSFIVGSFPRQIETPQQIAGQVGNYRLLGLSQEDLEQYRTRVAALDVQDIRDVAREHIRPDEAVIVVVGDATQVGELLAGFGPITLIDVEGNPLEFADLEIRASEVSFDANLLEPGSWTYQVLFQGQAVGQLEQILEVVTDDPPAAYHFTANMAAGPQRISNEVTFTVDFTPVKAAATMAMGGMEFGGEAVVIDGRVTGSFKNPQGETSFDEEVVAGALLAEMEDLAIWVADLVPGGEITFPVISRETGTTSNVTVKVVEEVEITVGAGTFNALKLEVSGADGVQVMHVMSSTPHIMLKLEGGAQPIVIELASIN